MTKKRKRRKPEQMVKAIQEGEAMLSAGKTLPEVVVIKVLVSVTMFCFPILLAAEL